jgi:16S rRNA (cytidine1402-2'-O)-methyltransferase
VKENNGKLYLVPTPIGNLQDMTYRAVQVLKSCDYVYAEDTRTTGILFKHYEINVPLRSFHLHNEHGKVHELRDLVANGKQVALVSDAGTPSISDPGYLAAKACVDLSLSIEALPGASAFLPALVESGLPCDKFIFEGFLPQKKGRKSRLNFLKSETRTIIFYESPYRILKLLQELKDTFGPASQVSISRELTKHFHETLRGDFTSLIEHFEKNPPKGEFVVIIHPDIIC